MIVLYILLALVVLMLLVLIHELGHYVAGKIFKFKINEFSIGFGHAIFKHVNKKTGEQFSIRWIPLGGYCAFEGEDEDALNPDCFNAQAWWKRVIVLMAGPLFNIIFGLFTVVLMLCLLGYDKVVVNEVSELNSSALQKGDIISEINGEYISIFQPLSTQIAKLDDGSTATLTIIRDGEKTHVDVQVIKDTNEESATYNQKIIGVTTKMYKYGFGQALGQAWVVTGDIIWQVFRSLGLLFAGKVGIKDISGPFGIIGGIATGTSQNMALLFAFIPLISINLGVFNLLPIPALDGARIVFVLIEAIRRRPINRKIEGRIHTIGLIVLFSLVILVDVVKLFL